MTYTPPFQIVTKPSSFGNAFARTFAPGILQVVHVTGNSDVAALPDGFTAGHSPYQDWLYAARNEASADGPSANDYVGRKGSTIEMWDPAKWVAWSNGDLKSPNLNLPGVRYLADLRARGINANRGCYREIELSGYPGSFDPTDEQIEVCAYFAAIDSIETGLDIVRGETMLTHADINSVDRANCAFRPAIREARMAELCARARVIRDLLRGESTEVRFVNANEAAVASGKRLPVKAGQEWQYLDGSYGGRFVGDATVPVVGRADAHKGQYVVQISTGVPYADKVARKTLVMVSSDTPLVDAPAPSPPDCSQAVADAKAAQHEATRAAAIAAVEKL